VPSLKNKIGGTRNNEGRMARKEDQKRGLGDYYELEHRNENGTHLKLNVSPCHCICFLFGSSAAVSLVIPLERRRGRTQAFWEGSQIFPFIAVNPC